MHGVEKAEGLRFGMIKKKEKEYNCEMTSGVMEPGWELRAHSPQTAVASNPLIYMYICLYIRRQEHREERT